MRKHKKYIINWLIICIVSLVYITLTPPTDTIKELIATWFIGLTTAGIGFCIDGLITGNKKDYKDYEDSESL